MSTGAIKGAEVGFSNSSVLTQRLGWCGHESEREEQSAPFKIVFGIFLYLVWTWGVFFGGRDQHFFFPTPPHRRILVCPRTFRMRCEMEDDGETDFRESPESSDTEAEEENKWAQGIKLYFVDEDVWVHYYQGGKAGAVGIWKKDGGASFVQNKSECTHLVINFVHTGVAERDRRASEDMCWAQNNGVGKLQRPIAAHACIAECCH